MQAIDNATFSRTRHYRSDFRTDLRLSPAQSAHCSSFELPKATKGHMVPAGMPVIGVCCLFMLNADSLSTFSSHYQHSGYEV